MDADKKLISDEKMDLIIGNILRVAVIISALFVIVGAAIYLWRHGMEMPKYGVFSGIPRGLGNLNEIIAAAWHVKSLGIIQLGLLILIFTPGLLRFRLSRSARLYVRRVHAHRAYRPSPQHHGNRNLIVVTPSLHFCEY